jgi:hypothetical protein
MNTETPDSEKEGIVYEEKIIKNKKKYLLKLLKKKLFISSNF